MKKGLFLGVAADDFTGASDAASFLAKEGISTVLFNGIPDETPKLKEDVQAVVVALKTRTEPRKQAVRETMEAFRWMQSLGAKQFYLKYCSTFDSTSEGNIGPVADCAMKEWGLSYTLLCPSLPVNGRTVKNGTLYVNGVLLEESHMKDHPLTPMRDSSVVRLMEAQSEYPAYAISVEEYTDETTREERLKAYAGGGPFYLVPDYYEEEHADRLAEIFGDQMLLTGGSGLVGALGRRYAAIHSLTEKDGQEAVPRGTEGKALLLAGSCSAITLKQIEDYRKKGYPTFRILPQKLLDQTETVDTIWSRIEQMGSGCLVYSSASPEDLKQSQSLGKERVAALLEQTLSELAARAVKNGFKRIISAGGETSGAVTRALRFGSFYIGESVAAGVPLMIPVEDPSIRLVLKSGNFGQEDFFERALRMTGTREEQSPLEIG